jgi:hypothetical protein
MVEWLLWGWLFAFLWLGLVVLYNASGITRGELISCRVFCA